MIAAARADELPRDVLATLYRAELGNQFNAAEMPRLVAAHELVERYFGSSSAAERTEIAAKIDAVGLDRSIVGRLARLRMGWGGAAAGGVLHP
jgi:hypothetical protein